MRTEDTHTACGSAYHFGHSVMVSFDVSRLGRIFAMIHYCFLQMAEEENEWEGIAKKKTPGKLVVVTLFPQYDYKLRNVAQCHIYLCGICSWRILLSPMVCRMRSIQTISFWCASSVMLKDLLLHNWLQRLKLIDNIDECLQQQQKSQSEKQPGGRRGLLLSKIQHDQIRFVSATSLYEQQI